jgi:RTX calcium-binding nonapeptide repeat (4 copies)
MRSLGLALLALVLTASPASAAVVSVEHNFCGCDPSSGDVDTHFVIVTAQPGELNRIAVERLPRGVRVRDDGAPLTGACRPANSGGGRFCRGRFDAVDVSLGDGDDSLTSAFSGTVNGGPGDDQIHTGGGFSTMSGGPGADLLDATGSERAAVTYADHTDGVTVRLDGVPDDGAAGEADNVMGPVTGITGGSGNDHLEAGPAPSGLFGEAGDDELVGSPQADIIIAGEGNDTLSGGGGNDHLEPGRGADDIAGGDGLDEAGYVGATDPLRLSIGDGANDGAAGENDDIHADIEALAGGTRDDVLIGSAGANRLIAYGGQDVLRGGAGPDELIGWDDGDELDAGPGPDRVQAGALDRPLLKDGEADFLNCRKHAPAIEADRVDVLRSCAPALLVLRRAPLRNGGVATLELRCPRDSAVPCQGRVWVHPLNRSRISRKLRYGPLEPGDRTRVRLRLTRRLPTGDCLQATAPTRRDDGLRTLTIGTSTIGCLVVPRLPRGASG